MAVKVEWQMTMKCVNDSGGEISVTHGFFSRFKVLGGNFGFIRYESSLLRALLRSNFWFPLFDLYVSFFVSFPFISLVSFSSSLPLSLFVCLYRLLLYFLISLSLPFSLRFSLTSSIFIRFRAKAFLHSIISHEIAVVELWECHEDVSRLQGGVWRGCGSAMRMCHGYMVGFEGVVKVSWGCAKASRWG